MYEGIVKRHRPRGWRVCYSKRKDAALEYVRKHPRCEPKQDIACAEPSKRTIYAPHTVDPFSLQILLHEFGHVHLHHWDQGKSVEHREEFEAERWAMEIMRMEGVKVPRIGMSRAKLYVRSCIKSDEELGHVIHSPAKKFVEKHNV